MNEKDTPPGASGDSTLSALANMFVDAFTAGVHGKLGKAVQTVAAEAKKPENTHRVILVASGVGLLVGLLVSPSEKKEEPKA